MKDKAGEYKHSFTCSANNYWIECLWKIKYSVVWKLHYLIYIELIHSAFQVYYSTFLPVYSINFGELDIETPTKNLNLST